MRLDWAVTTDHLVPRAQAARVLRAGISILLCMGLFSRFCVWALKCPGKAGSERDHERPAS